MLSLCHFSNPSWIVVHSMGATGGILLMWDKEMVNLIEAWADSYLASFVATCKGEVQRWMVMRVYRRGELIRRLSLKSLTGLEVVGIYLGVLGGGF